MPIAEHEVYARIGAEGFEWVVAGFYRRVRQDELLGPMYDTGDWEGAEWRLRAFLVGRFGGPNEYMERRGHPRLRMRHAPFDVSPPARDRWVQLMTAAVAEAGIDAEAAELLTGFFGHTATFLINRQSS